MTINKRYRGRPPSNKKLDDGKRIYISSDVYYKHVEHFYDHYLDWSTDRHYVLQSQFLTVTKIGKLFYGDNN